MLLEWLRENPIRRAQVLYTLSMEKYNKSTDWDPQGSASFGATTVNALHKMPANTPEVPYASTFNGVADAERQRTSQSSGNRSDLLKEEAAQGYCSTTRCSPPDVKLHELDSERPAASAFSKCGTMASLILSLMHLASDSSSQGPQLS